MLPKTFFPLVSSLLLLAPCKVLAQKRVFVDDHGVEHSTDKAKPTFVTRARNALFFVHHGAGTSQIVATCKFIHTHFSFCNCKGPTITIVFSLFSHMK